MSEALPTFTALVDREDDLWVVTITGPLPQGAVGVTDTPRFDDVAAETRDLIADLIDLDEDRFHVRYRYTVTGRDVTADVGRFHAARDDHRDAAAREIELRAARDGERIRLLKALADAGLSQRAMSDVVGLSQQRVNQILAAARHTDERTAS